MKGCKIDFFLIVGKVPETIRLTLRILHVIVLKKDGLSWDIFVTNFCLEACLTWQP